MPEAYASGAPYNGAFQTYYVPPSYGTALFIGDPVIVVDNSADANGVPAVNKATLGSSNFITGAFIGIVNNAGLLVTPVLQSSPVYLPASVGGYIAVADDPNLLFKVQEDSNGGALAAGAASRNINLSAGSGGSTYSGFSSVQLQSSSLATTNTLQMRILRAYQSVDNAIGNYAKWLCRINLHSITNLTGV
jgi:hypothetical protein